MKKTSISMFLLAFSLCAQAQGISEDMLQTIRKSQPSGATIQALSNAIASNAIDLLARNRDSHKDYDKDFSIETKSQNITDQKSSGRCWMFSGFNVLRSDFALRTDSLRVDLSQAYTFFWDQLEKANMFLQNIIDYAERPIDDPRIQFFFRDPIGDGGTFCGVADLTEKYGLCPKAAMPESFSADNTSKIRSLLRSKLREDGLKLRKMVADGKSKKDIETEKTQMLSTIYHMLTLTIGTPPTEFKYAFRDAKGRKRTREQTFTPQTFFDEVVGHKLNSTFIMVMNDPRREYFKTYKVEFDRHTYDGHDWVYVNLPMDEIEKLAITTLKAGHKLYSSYDVAKFLDRTRGYADINNFDYGSLFSTDFTMNKAERISTFDSGSTHAMTLSAVDLDEKGKPIKWKVENSWGATWGQNNGCIIMTDEWFREYMFRLVVPIEFVPKNIMRASQLEPTIVPPEDPLFSPDED